MAGERPSDGDLQKVKNLFIKWISSDSPQDLNLLISGKTGVGKSRLVNTLVGRRVAEESHKKDPCTSKVTSYQADIQGVIVTVWDSPGLQDGTTKEDKYIQDMKDTIKDIALIVYCVRMDEARFYDADKKAIRTLTDAFGKEVWKHAVVALTFANKIKDPDEEDELGYFQSQFEEWKKQFKEYFVYIDIDPEVCIPVIPVGNKTKKPKSMRLPDRENWLSDLWIECYHVMKSSARLGMFRINKNRLRMSGSTAIAKTDDHEFSALIPLREEHQGSFYRMTWEAFLPVLEDLVVPTRHLLHDVILPFLRNYMSGTSS